MYQSKQAGWQQPSPLHYEGSWQQGSSEQWHHGNFDNYQQQHYEEVSSGHQGGCMSFSARGYHDQQMDHSCLNTRLTTIEEAQHDFATPCTSTVSGKQTWEIRHQHPAKLAAREWELELFVPEAQLRPVTLNDYNNTQLGGGGSPIYLR
jgi:hypothetical protein